MVENNTKITKDLGGAVAERLAGMPHTYSK